MNNFPRKCLVDTNVPIIANLATAPEKIPDDLLECVEACVEVIEHVVKRGGLVLDAGDEICEEYRHKLSMSGQPGVGDKFVKWVHDHRWSWDGEDRVEILKKGNTYQQFPTHPGLKNFDLSDRKFVAVAIAHPEIPPIFEATDSKWWGWKDALKEVGITTLFLCPDYAEKKYQEKMEK
ncbi:MAG: hypothetical protein HQL07_09530 [Nitrospirae bacterium]|nr:hypothetical protein [Magnetococcales bacterium]